MTLPAPFDRLPAEARHPLSLSAGAPAFLQGDPTRGLFLVRTGSVMLIRHSAEGQPIPLHHACAGDTFAEASLFSDTYHCDAIALGSSALLRLDRQAVLDALQSDPAFAAALCQRLAAQVQGYRRDIALRSIRGAEARVRAALDLLARSPSIAGFADRIGLTPEATYRALSALAKKGQVQHQGRGRYRPAPRPDTPCPVPDKPAG